MAKYVDDDRILTCKNMREAIRLCVETSGKQIKEVASDLGMPKENLYRMINSSDDPRHFPPEKLPMLMKVCGNEKPLIWLSLNRGYGLYRLPEMVEAECRELKEKLRAAGGDRKSEEYHESVPEILPEPKKQDSRDQAAKLVGVSGKYVSDVKAISKAAPELVKKIESGEITIPEAKREVQEAKQLQKQKQQAPPPVTIPVCTVSVPFGGRMKLSTLISMLSDVLNDHGDIIVVTRSGAGKVVEIGERES